MAGFIYSARLETKMKILTLEQFLRRHKKDEPREAPTRQSRALLHWKILVVAFFLASAWVVASSFWVYQEINQGPDAASAPQTDNADLFKTELNTVIQYYDSQNTAFLEVQKNKPSSADPSL